MIINPSPAVDGYIRENATNIFLMKMIWIDRLDVAHQRGIFRLKQCQMIWRSLEL